MGKSEAMKQKKEEKKRKYCSVITCVERKTGKTIVIGKAIRESYKTAEIEASLNALKEGSILDLCSKQVLNQEEYAKMRKGIPPSFSDYLSQAIPPHLNRNFSPHFSSTLQENVILHLNKVLWNVKIHEGELKDYNSLYPFTVLPHLTDYIHILLSLPPFLPLSTSFSLSPPFPPLIVFLALLPFGVCSFLFNQKIRTVVVNHIC